jgi:hypothetical protein
MNIQKLLHNITPTNFDFVVHGFNNADKLSSQDNRYEVAKTGNARILHITDKIMQSHFCIQ